MGEAQTGLSAGGVFTYLESVVRGIMATWCFSDGEFDMRDEGRKYLACAVGSVFPMASSSEGPPASR